MKLYKKGFLLAEVVIVASVVSTVLIFLYVALSRMSNAYDMRNRYYDIDAMYAAIEINDSYKDSFNEFEPRDRINRNNLISFYEIEVGHPIVAYYTKSNNLYLGDIEDEVTNQNF